MPAIPNEPVPDQATLQRPALAPWQHTIFLVGVLVLWALYGGLRSRLSTDAIPLVVRYISSVVMQSLLVGSTIAGIYSRRNFFVTVLGRPNARRLIKDLLQGIGIFLTGLVVLACVRFALKPTVLHGTYRRDVVQHLLPQSGLELAFWIAVGIAAGTGEELVFRGYLQMQITKWLGNVPAAILLCALLFGCMHFYQGAEGIILTSSLGVLYGACAWRMGHLRGVMIAHSLEDITAGLVNYLRH